MTERPRPTALDGQLLTPADIGDLNRSRVIQALCDYGPLSRAELAQMAGVTRATIGNIVADLLEAGLIKEGAPRESAGRVGKPGRPVWFGARAGLCGAISLEAGTLEAALVNARGELLDQATCGFDANDPDGGSAIESACATLEAVLPRSRRDLLGVGVAVPGVCDTAAGSVLGSGQIPGLRGKGLRDALARRFKLRVLVDNDSRAQALGEKWFGAGRRTPTFASIQTGHGIGVGLVLRGVVLRGARGEAGEAGHMRVAADGPECRCGLRGCWETVATLPWLRAEADRSGLAGAAELDARSLVVLAGSGDAAARELLERYAANIAVGMANLTQVLSPGLFIVHGDVVGGGETLRSLIEDEVRARVLPYLRPSIEVVASELDRRAGLLGATGLVLSETFHLSI